MTKYDKLVELLKVKIPNLKILYKNEEFDNLSFTINYLKDEDYFIRMKRFIGEAA